MIELEAKIVKEKFLNEYFSKIVHHINILQRYTILTQVPVPLSSHANVVLEPRRMLQELA
jgi:hypothetical protein